MKKPAKKPAKKYTSADAAKAAVAKREAERDAEIEALHAILYIDAVVGALNPLSLAKRLHDRGARVIKGGIAKT